MALLIEATVGAVFNESLRTVLEFKNKTVCFKSSLVHLQSTLVAISPVIKEIEQQNNELKLPKEELQSFIRKMEEGTQLVFECSKIRWLHFVTRACYKDKLDQFSDELVKLFAIDMQAQMARDRKETLLKVRRILRVVEKTCFDPGEAIDNTVLRFLTWISVFAVKLIRVISALRWIFLTLIRVAFTFSSTKQEQFSLDKQLKRKKGYLLSARSLTIF
ncbi:putative disease resistance protein [Glycine soja]